MQLHFKVSGPSGTRTVSIGSTEGEPGTFSDLQKAIALEFSLDSPFELMYGYPPPGQLLDMAPDAHMTTSSKTLGALRVKLPATEPQHRAAASSATAAAAAATAGHRGPIDISRPPPGVPPEIWLSLPADMRLELLEDQQQDEDDEEEEDDDDDEHAGHGHAGHGHAGHGHAGPGHAGHAGHVFGHAPPTQQTAPAPSGGRGGFGARVATLGGSSTQSISSNSIGGGVRPGQSRIGRVQPDSGG